MTDLIFKYDFIYSTIILQYISVHSIRMEFIKDIYKQLSNNRL